MKKKERFVSNEIRKLFIDLFIDRWNSSWRLHDFDFRPRCNNASCFQLGLVPPVFTEQLKSTR